MSSITIDNTTPLGSADSGTTDDEFRNLKTGVYERERQGGHRWTTGGADGNNDGKHVPVDTATPPAPSDAGEWDIWDAAGTTKRVRVFGSTHATQPNQIEIPGDLMAPGIVYILKGGKAVGAILRAVVGDPAPINSAYLRRVVYKVPSFTGAPGRTLQKLMVIVGTRPVGADLVVTVRKLAAPAVTVDRFTDGSSSQIATVTLTAASGNYAVEATALAQALAIDDELVIKYGAVGGGTVAADVTIILQIE